MTSEKEIPLDSQIKSKKALLKKPDQPSLSEVDAALEANRNKASASVNESSVNAKVIDAYLKAISDFNNDSVDIAKGSAKLAWKVATGFGVIGVLSVGAVIGLTPLKEVQPFVVRVNDTDGSVTILRPLKDAKKISYGEVLDKHWARKFVTARNSYDWKQIQSNYNLVDVMSSGTVKAAYDTYIKADTSPVNTFVDRKSIKIEIIDTGFLPSKNNDLVQVRFKRDVLNSKGETASDYKPTFWNATMTFDYKAKITSNEERELNPLGFRITSYVENRVIRK